MTDILVTLQRRFILDNMRERMDRIQPMLDRVDAQWKAAGGCDIHNKLRFNPNNGCDYMHQPGYDPDMDF